MRSDAIDGGVRSRWIGRVLRDRWRIDARISRGGVGTVYAATHKNNGSRAAIKVLHPEFARDPDTRSRFLQEGYAANQVNHPGVVRILDDDTTEDGHAYLVMELLEGEVLETRRERKGGRLPLADVYEVGEQLLDVLAAAHEKGIVHRDIKPENLFVTHEGRLKVLDFGFAQMKSGFRTEQTATGFLLGTPGFMSPEQAVGNRQQIDAQTDIWAVGATLFTLISGEPVHAGTSAAELLVAAANYPARSLATVASGLSRRLVEVVDRAVAFEKAERWPNARSMQLALRGATSGPISGQVSRRSIPDEELTYAEIEELDASELVEMKGSASWPGAERTLLVESKIPRVAMPSSITRPNPSPHHASDADDKTLSTSSPITDPSELAPLTEPPEPPPHTPHMLPRPSGGAPTGKGTVRATEDGGTLIMESSPALADAGTSGAYPPASAAPTTAPKPFGQPLPPPEYGMSDPRIGVNDGPPAMRGDDLMFVAGPANPAPSRDPASRAPRALVLVGVAFVTMIVVIVTGLIVLAVAD